jgi:hypothetical protein
MTPRRPVLLIALSLLLSSPALAAQDVQGTRSLGMGGTLRASPSADSAILLNPAGMALFRAYNINAFYSYRGSDAGSLVNASIVDSFTAKIAAGLSYSFIHASPSKTLALATPFPLDTTLNTHEAALALAYPLGDVFFIGLTGRYVYQSVDQTADVPAGPHKLENINSFTMDVGAILRPWSSLSIAVTGQNLIGISKEFYPRLLGMGIAYALGTRFNAEFDSVLNFSTAESVKASYHVGGELFLGGSYAVRAGYMYDMLRSANYVTGGLGLVSSKISLDFGLRQMVSGGADTTIAFSVRLSLQ